MKIHQRYRILVLAIPLFAGSFFAGAASAGSRETLVIAGTGASIGTMQLMVNGFQKKHPAVNVEVVPSIGSTGGIRAAQEGKIDIGLSSRPLTPEERSALIVEEPYARIAFIFGVQYSNPTRGLTLAEIENIYAGKQKNWPDGKPIRLILRPRSDSQSAYLSSINPGLKSASGKSHSIPGVFVANTDPDAALQIEKTPGSFGTTTSSLVKVEKRNIKVLSIDGVAPTLSNVSSGKYPYAVTLLLVYKKDKYGGSIKNFIEYVFSRDGKKILSDNGQVALPRNTGK